MAENNTGMETIIFCNVAWMKNYHGVRGDTPTGGGAFVNENGTGSERHNFNPSGGMMRGYVSPHGSINLQRLGANPGESLVKNITVVWVAPSPLGRSYIVGWYLHAMVYHKSKTDHRVTDREFNVAAEIDDCVLLPLDARNFEIPRGKGGMGQSNVWYADSKQGKFIENVRAYIKGKGSPTSQIKRSVPQRKFGRKADPLKNVQVEKAAVRVVTKHFKRLGYWVDSIEKDNLGWDLQAYLKGNSFLRLEVKGLSGDQVSIDLTPNEYRNMNVYSDTYRICIVTNALTDPQLYVFSYSPNINKWTDENNRALSIQKITSARMTLE